jgi:demethylmenaquinone methyltransferase/2-methoxy-6-polyprenyl-1,4-benzoquinol methylase
MPVGTAVKPYQHSQAGKKQQVEQMFDSIAPKYDLLNHTLTAGVDIRWRRKAIRMLGPRKPRIVLDIATGTGDFALEALRLKPDRIIGLDISEGMLAIGRKKVEAAGASTVIEMVRGDSEKLDLPDNFADAITVGFGVRNFENLEKGLGEMLRVLKPGGVAIVLEPSFPRKWPLRNLFAFYFKRVLPTIGRLVSKDTAAYTYLPTSVAAFPAGPEFLEICQRVGYSSVRWRKLSLGICALYWLEK